jgi:hypothetical protein
VIHEHRPARSRHESDESLEESRGLEAERRGAVGERTSKTEEELALRGEGELLGGEGRAEDVAGKSFAAEAFARGDAHGGVEREAGGASAERSGSRGAARGSGIAEAWHGLTSFGAEGLTADNRARVASGEEGLFFESRVFCCAVFVGGEEPELLEMTEDAALYAREHAFDVAVFEDLEGVESGGCAVARGIEDAVEDEGVEMDVQIQCTPKALHHDHGTWATRVEASFARTTS